MYFLLKEMAMKIKFSWILNKAQQRLSINKQINLYYLNKYSLFK